MTAEEAVTLLEATKKMTEGISDLHKVCEMAISALEKSEKYRWHDLRKNPEDLPEKTDPVLICDWVKCDESHIGYELGVYSVFGWMKQTNHKILAWRYIEPLEEEE